MAKPVYKNERTLFTIAAVISALCWAGILFATKGGFLIFVVIFYVFYLFAESALISYLKGTGALVSAEQFPDIHRMVQLCAEKVELKKLPKVYILNGNGVLNAFATHFLRHHYIVLFSDVLDAFEAQGEPIHFYIGHEMGHIDRKHLLYAPFLSIGLVLPLLGSGYSRAREYTCDLYGAACCSPGAARQGLAALAVGKKRHATINLQAYMEQVKETSGFWMSFNELVASYPWLTKRLARIPGGDPVRVPVRNPFAYLPAIFIPRLSVMSLIVIYAVFIALIGSSAALKFPMPPRSPSYEHESYEQDLTPPSYNPIPDQTR